MKFVSSVVLLTLIILAGHEQPKPQTNNGHNGFDLVDETGNIRKPSDVRDRFQALGTYMVLDPKGNQMHATYASPGTLKATGKPGSFPTELFS